MQLLLASNQLSGTIPIGIAYLSISHIGLSHNNFNGTLDFAMDMLQTYSFRLDHNWFSGSITNFRTFSAQVRRALGGRGTGQLQEAL